MQFSSVITDTVTRLLKNKTAFVPSPQTQQAIADAQAAGIIPAPPQDPAAAEAAGAPAQEITPDILAQLIEQFYQETMAAQQQILALLQQLVAQQGAVQPAGGQGEAGDVEARRKKPSMEERVSRIEQILEQALGGAAVASQAPPPAAVPQA